MILLSRPLAQPGKIDVNFPAPLPAITMWMLSGDWNLGMSSSSCSSLGPVRAEALRRDAGTRSLVDEQARAPARCVSSQSRCWSCRPRPADRARWCRRARGQSTISTSPDLERGVSDRLQATSRGCQRAPRPCRDVWSTHTRGPRATPGRPTPRSPRRRGPCPTWNGSPRTGLLALGERERELRRRSEHGALGGRRAFAPPTLRSTSRTARPIVAFARFALPERAQARVHPDAVPDRAR